MKAIIPVLLVLAACGREDTAAADTSGNSAPQPIDFEKIAAYEFKPGAVVPEEVRAMHGKKVRITGYIYPTNQIRDLKEFILMKDRGTCCYGPKTQWTHFLQVTIRKPIHYSPDPVTVVGTFRVEEKVEDGYVLGLYYLDAEP